MAFCPNCGAPVQGKFCAKCGATIAAAPPGGNPAPPPGGSQFGPAPGTFDRGPSDFGGQQGYAPPPPPPAQEGGLQSNVANALCYLLGIITGVLFLVLEPYNRNKQTRFHAFQAIFFSAGMIVLSIVLTIVGTIIAMVPVVGWMISLLLSLVLWLGSIFLWLFLMWKAYNNEKFVLPIVGPLAEKQA